MKTSNASSTSNACVPVETKAASPRKPQHAWEMTLEQFRQTYFPELCGEQKEAASTIEPTASQRTAA